MDDALLVSRLIARDPGAWEELLRRHGGLLEASCRRALLDARRADLLPDACADVIRSLLEDDARLLRNFRPGTPLGAYLRVVARSRTLDLLRKTPPSPFLPVQDVTGEDPNIRALESAERGERLRKALATLAPREAEALRLFHLDELPYAEIARRLSVPETQVGMVLARARERLRDELGEDFLESV